MGRIFRPTSIVKDADGNPVRDADGHLVRKARTANWCIRYYDADGRAHDESTGSTKIGDARRLLRDREHARDKGEPVGPRIGKITFEEAAADIVTDYKLHARRSLNHLTGRIDNHLRPAFGGRRLAAITTSDLRAYRVRRGEAGASVAQINRELAIVKRMFTLALQAGTLLHRPHVPMIEERNVRQGYFEAEQFAAVRAELPAYLQPVATFMYLTGWRSQSEVLPLQVRQVDLAGGLVTLDRYTTKNDEARAFDFGPVTELRAVLTAQLASAERLSREHDRIVTHVFHQDDGAPVSIKRFYKAWHKACEAAGYPARIPHDFRRTAVRNLIRAGVAEDVAMRMTGHKTRSVFARYNIVTTGDLADAGHKLEAFHTTPRPAADADGPRPAQVRQFKARQAGRVMR